jgi:ribose 5-phosphate isomerase A
LDIEILKKNAAEKAVDYVDDGMIVGLGTGSTVKYALNKLAKRIKKEKIKIVGIPTSSNTSKIAKELNIPLSTLDECEIIDLTIDGADEIDENLNLIKGGGGALTREKIIAANSKKVIIVADETKITKKIGISSSLPVEILPFGYTATIRKIEELGCTTKLRQVIDNPYITDNGNYIVDCDFDGIDEPEELDAMLNNIPGVVENGLFVNLATMAIIGSREGIKTLEK